MKKLNILQLNRMNVADYREAHKVRLVVVLDNVRSLHNVGSVFRTSDAYRVESIYLCGVTATPPSAEIHKTALGAEDSVAWQYFKDTREAVEQLHRESYTVLSIEQVEGSTALQDLRLEKEKRCAARGCRHERWLHRAAPVWHQALAQRVCHGRHCHLGVCSTAVDRVTQ